MFELKSELNEQQLSAATHVNGPILVIAGAGSGKTRVITYRIANLIKNHNVQPWRIMAVTFTNKAAKEMSHRVEQLIGKDAKCWISTFHASCAKILRQWGEIAGIDPKFTIYDDSDQKAMINRVLKELDISTKQFPPRAIQSEINKAKRELIKPSEYDTGDFYRGMVQKVYDLYEKRMKDAHALDFGDLLYRTVRAMQEHPELAKEISGKFDYVMVDEFQDTNKVQLELVRLLTPHRNICVVGDDDQSIYSWRGADVTNILDFEKLFTGAKVVTLDRNYRSTQNILKASHGVVSKLPGRRPKELWTSSGDGEKIYFITAPDEREEGRLAARKIKELQADGTPLNSQVLFYRTNAQSRVFEEVFRSMNIPHRVIGGMRFYERAEVKDIIAYLRLIQNPADHAAFTRIINTPARGIGKTTIDQLISIAAGKGISLFEAIDFAQSQMKPAATKKLIPFRDMISRWIGEIESGPSHLAARILEDTGYMTLLEKENTAEADARIENIKELIGSIEDFEADAETPDLSNLLEIITLQTDVDSANFDDDQVTMMTVHAAKGLEFDVVYVTGMEEGLFPLIRQSNMYVADEADEEIDEERRLGYVAMTRAKKKLFLMRAKTRKLYGNTRSNPPSRFLANIQDDICEDISPRMPKSSLIQSGRKTGLSNYNGSYSKPSTPTGSKSDVWVDTSFDQSSDHIISITPGHTVSHPKFGKGKVMSIIPGAMPKADILFPGFGRKTILIKFLEIG
ncbi:MAG: UvrD-helicase domain-containing protein [Deltaproteobacteria bacterium]|nr:UvrD-helicase domain-containing protein [Deltaproteobacteria bacterium]